MAHGPWSSAGTWTGGGLNWQVICDDCDHTFSSFQEIPSASAHQVTKHDLETKSAEAHKLV